MRLFTSADQIGVFEPVGPGDEPLAKQASEYTNWVLMKQNPGISIMHDWFKDAILQKVGIIKAYWDDSISVTKEQYANLTDDELAMIMSDGTMEIAAQETIEQDMDGQVMRVHNVALMKQTKSGKIKIENVPPEEFLISKAGKTVRDTPFVAHRKLITRSDLVAMGFDPEIVMNLPVYNDLEFSAEYIARYNRDEQPYMEPSLDKSMQTVEVFECYLKTDYDGDGIAELRRVHFSGNEILSNEETDYVPFYTLCPIPIPHRFFGDCPADRTVDLQLIKTTLTRQMLDNLHLQNNTRMGAVEGQVNLDDLMSVTPGGVVRMKNHFKSLRDHASEHNDWALLEFRASETGLIPQAELDAAKSEMGDDKYLQEFECSFDSAIEGSYYGQLLNELPPERFHDIPVDGLAKTYCAWDLGIGDSTAIWVCQRVGLETRLIDFVENHGQGLDWYVNWLRTNHYELAEQLLPHDVQVRELGTGRSRMELLQEAGLNITIVPRMSVDDGIQPVS